mmetsp:Transcript_9248/g.22720  ORF Transcript_9248/g.22720 Transcript_9248/m.22720 type:complete len:107 (+) Transcript_9248:639-959(+)
MLLILLISRVTAAQAVQTVGFHHPENAPVEGKTFVAVALSVVPTAAGIVVQVVPKIPMTAYVMFSSRAGITWQTGHEYTLQEELTLKDSLRSSILNFQKVSISSPH